MSRASTISAPQQAPKQQQRPIEEPFDPETPLLNQAIVSTISRLEKASDSISKQLEKSAATRLLHSAMMGVAVDRLKAMITKDIADLLMKMMNTQDGFKTDRGEKQSNANNRTPYDRQTVIDCTAAALMRGVLFSGNMFNILFGECFITANGWLYKLQQIPGFSDFKVYPGTPAAANGQPAVRIGASWKMNGIKDDLRDAKGDEGIVFAVKVQSGMGPEAVVGKAKARAYRLIYETLTNTKQTNVDDDDVSVLAAAPVNGTAKAEPKAETPPATKADGEIVEPAPVDDGINEPPMVNAETVKLIHQLCIDLGLTDKVERNKAGVKQWEQMSQAAAEQWLSEHQREPGDEPEEIEE